MKNILDIINESKNNTLSDFKDGSDSIISMIVKRMEIWDANKTPTARIPMFLVDENRETINWTQQKYLTMSKESGETVERYDSYLKEYLSSQKSSGDGYILGVFIDRCFIPITNRESYQKIIEMI